MIDLAQAKADYSRTTDPVYDSIHCPVPTHRLADYRKALRHMGGLIEELEELRKAVKK